MEYGIHTYNVGRMLDAEDLPFYALIQAAMRKADSENIVLLREAWPECYAELQARYNASNGKLVGE